jgi:TolB protein
MFDSILKEDALMAGCRFKILCFLAILVCFVPPKLCRAEYNYIDISNPFLHQIPIAIPLFKTVSGSAAETQLSEEISNLLSETLQFTGYFKMIDRGAFLFDPQKSGIVAPDIRFRNWTTVGAELLITGGLLAKEDKIDMELRLFDTFKERLLVGKRYKGWKTDYRKMIHRFCSEVIFCLTGNRGVFDSKIAFVSTGSGNKEIYTCEFDGYSPKQVTHAKSICLSPAWSSDGVYLAYTSYAKGKPDLYIRQLELNRGAVVASKGVNITPAWVPGKFELAATLSFAGDPEIYLLTGEGKIIKRLTNNNGIDVSPSWSPDAKKMAFVSNRSGSPQIYVMDVGSGRVERVTFEGRYNTSPSWSPRGDRIAYCGLKDGRFNIFVVSSNGGRLQQLTHDSGDNESPSWSPDGSLIVFSSTREGPSRIYVMTAYGTDQKRLLALPGEQTNPKWSPNGIKH